MVEVEFDFKLDDMVIAEKTGFQGVIKMCAIQGDPEHPEIVYYISGANTSDWYPERLLSYVKNIVGESNG